MAFRTVRSLRACQRWDMSRSQYDGQYRTIFRVDIGFFLGTILTPSRRSVCFRPSSNTDRSSYDQ